MKTIQRFIKKLTLIFFLGILGQLLALPQNYSENDEFNYDDGYSSGTVINNYFGSDYTYGLSYTSRIRRFHGNFCGLGYYSPWFTDYIGYYDPGYTGIGFSAYPFSFNIYLGWGSNFYYPTYYQSWVDPWFYSWNYPRVRIKIRNRYRYWNPSYYRFYNYSYSRPVYFTGSYYRGSPGYRYVPGLGYRSYSASGYRPVRHLANYSNSRAYNQAANGYVSKRQNNNQTTSRSISRVNNINVNNRYRNGNNRGYSTTARGNNSRDHSRSYGNVYGDQGNRSTITRTVTNSTAHRRTGDFTRSKQVTSGRSTGVVKRTTVKRTTVNRVPQRSTLRKPSTFSGRSSYRKPSANKAPGSRSIKATPQRRGTTVHTSRSVKRTVVSKSQPVNRSSARRSSSKKVPVSHSGSRRR